jgi:hypothetical protein
LGDVPFVGRPLIRLRCEDVFNVVEKYAEAEGDARPIFVEITPLLRKIGGRVV